MQQPDRLRQALFYLASLIVAVGLGYYMAQPKKVHPPQTAHVGTYRFFDTLIDLHEDIRRDYVRDVTNQTLLDGAIQGMMQKLDPYSTYFTPAEWKAFDRQVHGQYSGIGVDIGRGKSAGDFLIITPLAGGPAILAGVQAGDRIWGVNDKSAHGWKFPQLLHAMTGLPGTTLELTLIHAGSNKPVQVTLHRAVIETRSVKGFRRFKNGQGTWDYLIDAVDRIAYVRITTFMKRTPKELDAALEPLIHSPGGLHGIILDLRFNPGGLLKSGISVARRFIRRGVIVSTRGRDGKDRFVARANGRHTYPNIPVVVLINQDSASAAEIVAGALRDQRRATLVGTRSFGKGSVQDIMPLDQGRSAVKLTTAYYYLPNGENIMRFPGAKTWGVSPSKSNTLVLTRAQNAAIIQARSYSDIIYPPSPMVRTAIDRVLGMPAHRVQFMDPQLQMALRILQKQIP